MKKVSFILAGVLVLSTVLVGCGSKKILDSTSTTAQTTESNKEIDNNKYQSGSIPGKEEPHKKIEGNAISQDSLDFKNIKIGDKIGELTVSKVDLENSIANEYFGSIKFSGEVTLEGEYERMSSPTNPITVIRMSLGEDSKSKLPSRFIKEDNKYFVYLPYSKQFGSKGKVKLVIRDYQVNVGIEEAWPNDAKISKIVELTKEEQNKKTQTNISQEKALESVKTYIEKHPEKGSAPGASVGSWGENNKDGKDYYIFRSSYTWAGGKQTTTIARYWVEKQTGAIYNEDLGNGKLTKISDAIN